MIEQLAGFRKFIGRRDLVITFGAVSPEKRIQPGGFGDLCHVGGCGVMIFIRKTVGIVKVCVLAAKKLGAPVHEFCEFLYRAGNFFCNGDRHFISGLEHDSHQGLIPSEFFTGSSINTGISGSYTGGSFFRYGNVCLSIQIFTGKQCSQDLCDAGRVELCVRIFGIKNGFCIYVHKDCSLCFDAGTFGPPVNGIGVGSL